MEHITDITLSSLHTVCSSTPRYKTLADIGIAGGEKANAQQCETVIYYDFEPFKSGKLIPPLME